MQIRHIGKGLAHLVDEELQNLGSFGALHVVAEGAHKGGAVSRHVDFGDEEHVVFLAELHQLLRLLNGVILALQTGHVHAVVQHREDFALQAPCLVFGEVPVEDIDFISREDFDFLLQLVHRQIAAADVVHEATDFERRPVDDFASLVSALLFFELTEGLQGPVHALLGNGFHLDALRCDHQSVGFLLIELGSRHFGHQLHFDAARCLRCDFASGFGNELLPLRLQHGCFEHHFAQGKTTAFRGELLRFRQQIVRHACHCSHAYQHHGQP